MRCKREQYKQHTSAARADCTVSTFCAAAGIVVVVVRKPTVKTHGVDAGAAGAVGAEGVMRCAGDVTVNANEKAKGWR